MEKKLLFIDIDGTLFDNERNCVPASALEALKQLREQDNTYVCIASGRSQVSAREVLDRYSLLFTGYVLINGQIVILNDQIIYENPLKPQFVKEYIAESERLGIPWGFISNDTSVVSSYHPLVVNSFNNFKMKLPEVVKEFDYDKAYYQGFFFDMNYLQHFCNRFKDDVIFYPWMFNDGADVIPVGSSKAIGMEKLRQALQVKQEHVYAIGDSTNDIEMLQYAAVGIAMGNAKPELKAVADYVTAPIHEDGLSLALKKFGFI